MKKFALIFVHVACASVLLIVACSNPIKNKLQGNWRSKDGLTKLRITEKYFSLDGDGDEDYFIKGDTVFTSYQGNQPYTTFVIQKLDDHYLKLIGPDSVAVEYNR